MSDIVSPAPWVALDANGNPVAAAEARFYRQGTTTPLTVYSDVAASSAHPVPLVADANGRFPAVFENSAFNVKVDVTDPTTGVSLPGYPVDYARLSSTSTGAAASISFSPTADIPDTDVQAAIEQVQANWKAAKTGADDGLVSGTAGTSGNLAQWNADGDLVDGPDVLDQDDMASDSATAVPTQQSTKAYVDTSVNAKAGMVHIATRTASTTSNLDFTEFNATLYGSYVFVITSLIPSTDGLDIEARFSTDGGSTYDDGASDYGWAITGNRIDASYFDERAVSDSVLVIARDVGNAANEFGLSATLNLYGAGDAVRTILGGTGMWRRENTNFMNAVMNGIRFDNAVVNAIRFTPETDGANFTSGSISMYGLLKST